MKQSKRIEYIDAAKGIAILLMIVGHCYWRKAIPGLSGFIYSFHMPLFFIISGMFWKSLSIKAAFGKYAKSYLWPYLIICIAILFIDLANAGLYGGSMPEIVQNGFLKIVWASNCLKPILFGDMPCIGAAWFLFALFWANVLLNLFLRFVGGGRKLGLLVLMATCVSLESIRVMEIPFSFQAGMVAILYVYIGKLVKEFRILDIVHSTSPRFKYSVYCFWIVVSLCTSGVDIGSGNLGFGIVGLTMSLIGSFIVMDVCRQFNLRMRWIGCNTLSILAAHIVVCNCLTLFGWHAETLPFAPLVNMLLELTLNISWALAVGWAFSNLRILRYPW